MVPGAIHFTGSAGMRSRPDLVTASTLSPTAFAGWLGCHTPNTMRVFSLGDV